ncbi:MAG: DUF2442 domain-containing protein [Muribaculaceae bacterium]|nr:DUF2442 domain-containing protein [Muribaculaceae bacterium]
MYIQVIDVEYGGNYTLKCTFNNGITKIVDMTPVLDAPAFRDLKDIEKFKQFGLDETIFWANGADIAPEWLYDHGVSVSA